MSAWSPQTGLSSLDSVLTGLLPGDNIVWRTDSTAPYCGFVESLRRGAAGVPVHYFRFADHGPLLVPGPDVQVHDLDPAGGFERFIARIHAVVEQASSRAYHVFDCLSGLAADWYSDTMLGCFFRLTCPFVLQTGSIAYFCVLRRTHSARSLDPIQATAQIVIDVYQHGGELFIHPLKVDQRHAPTLHLLHRQRGAAFVPVTASATVARVLSQAADEVLERGDARAGVWQRTFSEAEELFAACRRGQVADSEAGCTFDHLLRMTVAREGPMLELARRFLTWEDVLGIGRRLIGTGLIGGKSVGMLLARAILRRASPRWQQLLEPHDSFYVGSDVFYTFLVENELWWVRQRQRDPSTLLADAELARGRILAGEFPDHIRRELGQVLDYLGQSPFIVRSSSLLEDNFGNAFSGKYESAFCANQGDRASRLAALLDAVRRIYASTMGPAALRYRAQRQLLAHDEQMALLIQRVSGSLRGRRYYPDAAGVGLSHNPYVWNDAIDPSAGLLRLVFGLGTRAVDRADDDYTRVVALNVPQLRPEATFDQVRRYAQHNADVLDLDAGGLRAEAFARLAPEANPAALALCAARDFDLERRARQRGQPAPFSHVLTFDGLLQQTAFAADMRALLQTLESGYEYPVDVEFTVNFGDDGSYLVNVVQCRPLQVREGGPVAPKPHGVPECRVVLATIGPVIGRSRCGPIDRVVSVDPAAYARLTLQERYSVARVIGRVTHARQVPGQGVLALVGPGRWGTTTPSLGIPVSFAEIDTASVLCEVVAMGPDVVPDVSLGTHFFNDLIEADVLYLALFPRRAGSALRLETLARCPNQLAAVVPADAAWAPVVGVFNPGANGASGEQRLMLHADSLAQRVVWYWDDGAAVAADPSA